jgi:hypothetical protein
MHYRQGDRTTRELIEGMASDNENGIKWAIAYIVAQKDLPPLYCPPKRVGLTGSQIIAILEGAVKASPSIGNDPYGLGILEALIETFPCRAP